MLETQLPNVESELFVKLHYEKRLTICEIERFVPFERKVIEEPIDVNKTKEPLLKREGLL
ncbi:hypothetical protein ABET51_15500 [Metabacillus fastidiosus]|uniref:hypothetical protein n=1 Tax=Metabacillus fastidiosus TaxID=1458 RepID=UPI002E24DF2D|nr:hypothetical protein [Metabacillus fastidiosus]